MEYIRLGKTGLKVSRICLGTMTYGSSKWRDWALEETEARPFFKRAVASLASPSSTRLTCTPSV